MFLFGGAFNNSTFTFESSTELPKILSPDNLHVPCLKGHKKHFPNLSLTVMVTALVYVNIIYEFSWFIVSGWIFIVTQ